MPIYEFKCEDCDHCFETRFKMGAVPKQTKCPKCSGVAKKIFSLPSIRFRGAGFYSTDYGKG